jgi:uncharacterized protein (TIGR00290 family)
MKAGALPHSLVTMLREDGAKSRSHGIPIEVYRMQAESLGASLVTRNTSWEGYREAFLDALSEVRECGVDLGVFGDIDLQEHRDWVSDVCEEAGMEPWLPLWREERKTLLTELSNEGYRATIVAIRQDSLDSRYLGRELDAGLIIEFESIGIDASGEAGEYHTVVTDGPAFSNPVRVSYGPRAAKDGCEFLEVLPAP